LDLHLEPGGRGVRAGLEAAVREAVRSGRLSAGVRLPSSRALAADLGIARNTVAEAYGQLVAEGWLLATQGSGTRVGNRAGLAQQPATGAPPLQPRYDLRPGSPDVAAFPRAGWLAAARRSLSLAPATALGYGDPRGRPELREALAGYLARTRGVRASPDRIVVCAGFSHGFSLLCQVLSARGATTLAVEGYSQPQYRKIAVTQRLTTTAVPVDAGGADIGRIGAADAVLLTPAHQFPLGMALAPARRSKLLDWAADHDATVIEDDYDGEFRYDRQPIGALQPRSPERIVYAGTTSKSLAPGLRLAWLVLPAHFVDDIIAAKALSDGVTSTLEKLTLAEFINSGQYDRQIRRQRQAYRRRRDQLLTALHGGVSLIRITGIAAGLHALLQLPATVTEEEVIARASRSDLALDGLNTYRHTEEPHHSALVIGYATPPGHAYPTAIEKLTEALWDR
jgi:GntR family transcriptional regulator/MocR family aminotransferase